MDGDHPLPSWSDRTGERLQYVGIADEHHVRPAWGHASVAWHPCQQGQPTCRAGIRMSIMIEAHSTDKVYKTSLAERLLSLARKARYRARHKEELRISEKPKNRARMARYRSKHREELREKSRNYDANHRESIRARVARWQRSNPEKVKAWRTNNPERRKLIMATYRKNHPNRDRAGHLRRKFNLTLQQFNDMVIAQNSKCDICGEPFVKIPNIDHDHATGLVRGLLCGNCNRGLGSFKDDTGRLDRAKAYLQRHRNVTQTITRRRIASC